MKRKLLTYFILIPLIIIMGCDSPRDRRKAYRFDSDGTSSSASSGELNRFNNYYSSSSENPSDNNVAGAQGQDDESENSSTDTDKEDTTNTQSNIPKEIDHCKWSTDGITGLTKHSEHLGNHTICQSRCNPNDVYIQVANPITDSQVCVIPTHVNGSSSVYIGEPRCLVLQDNKRIYKVTLFNNRPGFSNFSINGAMVMKDKAYLYPYPFSQDRLILAPDAYIFCSQYLDQYRNSAYCQAFKNVGEYVAEAFPTNLTCN